MKYFKKIEGEKVYLSPMNLEDIEKYVKWMNDFSTTDGLGSSSKVTTFESERAWLINNMDKKEQQFAIVLKETDKLIGNCGFVDINHLHQRGEVGLFIGEEENRSKGYGTEALSLLAFSYFEGEDYKMAAVTWAMMLRLLEPDDPRVPMLEKSIRAARDALALQEEEKAKSITPEK